VAATAFHCDRRMRVLARDIFRFGTATVLPSLGRPGAQPGLTTYVLGECWAVRHRLRLTIVRVLSTAT
jgi:hypothetical protein